MYTPPNLSFFGAITPIAGGIDLSLHTFLGISWSLLLPYTLFGLVLMAYSHSRLMKGQYTMKHEELLDDVELEELLDVEPSEAVVEELAIETHLDDAPTEALA